MESLIYMSYKLEPIFYKFISMTITASLIGIMILIIKTVLKKQISPKWISRIWLVFIISLIIPIEIKTNFSIYNLLPNNLENIEQTSFSKDKYYEIDEGGYFKENINRETKILETSSISNENVESVTKNQNISKYSIKEFLPILWFTIVMTMLISYILVYIVFEIKILKNPLRDVILNDILSKTKEKIGVKKKIKLVDQSLINMPSLFGIFYVRILLNKEILTKSDKEIEHIFLHELAHYKRKDNVLNIIITFLKCVYFWNPIIWILLNEVKKDMEFSADELAMLKETKDEKKEYCKTLVKVSVVNSDLFLIQTMCLSENKKILERRIEMMKSSEKFKSQKGVIAIISVIIIILLIAIFYTRANNSMSKKDIIELLGKTENISNVYVQEKYHPFGDETNVVTNYEKYFKDGILMINTDILLNGEIVETDSSKEWKNYNTGESIGINLYEDNSFYVESITNDEFSLTKGYIEQIKNNKFKYLGEEKLEGKDVYVILIGYDENKLYIDKENGLVLKASLKYFNGEEEKNAQTEYKYEFNIVTDENVTKPKIEDYPEYKIVNK